MYNVDTPADFADHLIAEDEYWPEDTDRPKDRDIEIHPQGQVYINVGTLSGEAVMLIIDRAERSGLRAEVGGPRLAIFQERPRCDKEGCFGRAKMTSPHRELCPNHAREAEKKRMERGLPPLRD